MPDKKFIEYLKQMKAQSIEKSRNEMLSYLTRIKIDFDNIEVGRYTYFKEMEVTEYIFT